MNRYPACKIRIIDLQKGKYVIGDNTIPNHVLLLNESKIVRVHIIGTILRIQQVGTTANIVIDDGSASILLRIFEEFPLIKEISAGNTVRVIGKIRAYKEQIYIVPEIIKECDKKWLSVHKTIKIEPVKKKVNEKKQKSINSDVIVKFIQNNDKGSGVLISEIIKEYGNVENIIEHFLKHGILYQNMPGKVKIL